MDKKAIETLSISAVRDQIVASDFLDQFISDNDKEPSWDGNIYIYDKKGKKKNDLYGRIPVQVKGTEQENLSEEKISFSISLVDMKNYLKDGGVFFFVVYISKDKQKKIYYIELTPTKLRSILNNSKDQKTKKLELKEFPVDCHKMYVLIKNFYNNCVKQKSFIDALPISIETFEKEGVLEGITIPVVTSSKMDPVTALLTSEVYIYAKTKGSSIPQPLGIVPQKLCVSDTIEELIKISDKIYYNSFDRIRTAAEVILKIGKSFTVKINTETSTCNFEYKTTESFRNAAVDLEFILSLVEIKNLSIGNWNVDFTKDEMDITNFNVETEREQLKYFAKAVKVLDLLNISGDLQCSKMSKTDKINMDILIKALIDKEQIENLPANLNTIIKIKICEYSLYIACLPVDDNESTYKLYDFFNKKFMCCYTDENGDNQPISQYMILKSDDYMDESNIRFDLLLPTLQENSESPDVVNQAISVLLDLLTAYDKSNGRKSILLKTAKAFAEWLAKDFSQEELNEDIKILNLLQVIRRERELEKNEIRQLYKIAEDSNLSENSRVGAYLLLNNQDAAEIHFNKLSLAEQNNFSKFPIYHFWNENNQADQHNDKT